MAVAGGDRHAAGRARLEREEQLLVSAIALAERRTQTIECGIDCLESDIANARVAVAGRPK